MADRMIRGVVAGSFFVVFWAFSLRFALGELNRYRRWGRMLFTVPRRRSIRCKLGTPEIALWVIIILVPIALQLIAETKFLPLAIVNTVALLGLRLAWRGKHIGELTLYERGLECGQLTADWQDVQSFEIEEQGTLSLNLTSAKTVQCNFTPIWHPLVAMTIENRGIANMSPQVGERLIRDNERTGPDA